MPSEDRFVFISCSGQTFDFEEVDLVILLYAQPAFFSALCILSSDIGDWREADEADFMTNRRYTCRNPRTPLSQKTTPSV